MPAEDDALTKNPPGSGSDAVQEAEDELSPEPKEDDSGYLPFPCVGLGASAGGLEALVAFFDATPADTGLAFVVVQHLSPDTKSLMRELLGRHTAMQVVRVDATTQIEPNTVYLIPPKKNMMVFRGKLLLTDQDRSHGLNLPIDIFLRSLAEDQGPNAVGIILSGTGSDGMRGVRAVKEAGGMVMVQDETSAKFDGMPRSAIATGLADFVLPPGEMPGRLVSYVKHPYIAQAAKDQPRKLTEEENLIKIIALLRKEAGVDFTHYKPSTVVRRIQRRMGINQIDSLDQYAAFLYQSKSEVNALYKDLLISVTKFFRDPEGYVYLERSVIPAIFDKHEHDATIRAWVPACSTGEEAYSLAMLFHEEMERRQRSYDIKIFATDIDRQALEFASEGAYPESVAADITTERLTRFFIKRGENYAVSRQVREMVIFAPQDVTKDPPFAKIDLVSCRNLLIYMQPVLQRKILSIFHFALRPEGYLFLGSSETVGEDAEKFQMVDSKWKIYRNRNRGAHPPDMLTPGVSAARRIRTRPAGGQDLTGAGESNFLNNAADILINGYAPPSMLLNPQNELVHSFGDLGDYLRIAPGRVSLDALKMVDQRLSVALATAAHRARKDRAEVFYKGIPVARKGDTVVDVDMRVRPLCEPRDDAVWLLVTIEERERAIEAGADAEPFDAQSKSAQRIADLENELQFTKENLQATIEELETSNEELQATNEELLAANEELQSTNEELQSVNEELHTLNAEYQGKIHELTQLNEDMDNLFRSTTLGTIFLDRNFRIRKFTPTAASIFNFLPQDVGRPLEHLVATIDDRSLVERAKQVLRTQEPLEEEVHGPDGDWLLMRILPYHTEADQLGGVVITFVPINELKRAQEQLRHERDIFARVMETSPAGIIVLDKEGQLTLANQLAEQLLSVGKDEITSRQFDDPAWRVIDDQGQPVPESELPFRRVMDAREPVFNIRQRLRLPGGTETVLIVNAAPLWDAEGNLDGVITLFNDITELHEARAELSELERLVHVVLATDADFVVAYWGPHAESLLGLPREEAAGKPIFSIVWRENPDAGEEIKRQVEETGHFEGMTVLTRADGKALRGHLAATKVQAAASEAFYFFNVTLGPA